MGAEDFYTVSSGKNPEEAFKSAIDETRYECGHRGYTGTIAEKNSFVSCSENVFGSYQEASDYAKNLIDESDDRVDNKWGPAGYVRFKNGTEVKFLFFGWASS